MQLNNVELPQHGFNPRNVLVALKEQALEPVLAELAEIGYYNAVQDMRAEIPAALKSAKVELKAQQAEHDASAERTEQAAAEMRHAKAARELIPYDAIAVSPEYLAAAAAVQAAENKYHNTHAELEQRYRIRLQKAQARVDNLTALEAALAAVEMPATPRLIAVLTALTERV
jgi:hypothetical protein